MRRHVDSGVIRWIAAEVSAVPRGETVRPDLVLQRWRERDVLERVSSSEILDAVDQVLTDLAFCGVLGDADGEKIMLHPELMGKRRARR